MGTFPPLRGALLLCVLGLMPVWGADDQVNYGKYLAEEVAKCADCHTPGGADGKLDQSKYMKGKVMEVQPI